MTLNSSSGAVRSESRRPSLKGNSLPDLATVNLGAEAILEGKPVLVCLFDAGQRPSRHVVRQLDEQAAGLKQKGVSVVAVQAALTSDETFNGWKDSSPVSFPIGRVSEKAAKCKWASDVGALPWLILAGPDHRVVAEGFALEELDSKLKQVLAAP